MKTFAQYCTERKDFFKEDTTKISEYLVGRNVKVVGNKAGHNYGHPGTIFKVKYPGLISLNGSSAKNGFSSAIIRNLTTNGNNIHLDDFVIVGETIEDVQNHIKDKEREIESLKEKIQLMKENDIDFLSDDMFKAITIFNKLKQQKKMSNQIQLLAEEMNIV